MTTAATPATLGTDPATLAARVVVGMDNDPASVAALRFAAVEAAYRGGDVVALHVFHYPSIWGVFPVWPEEGQPAGYLSEQLRATVDAVLAEREAAGVALLVLGARHHNRLLGSVRSMVLSHSADGPACPVVVVPAGAQA